MISARTATLPADPAPSTVLASGLAVCDRLLAQHLGAVRARFGQVGLGLIDLPELGPEPLIAGQIRLAAALYWCRELEEAGVLPFVEALAGDLQRGAGGWVITTSADLFRPFWRQAPHRFLADERTAVYTQVFPETGTGVPQGFDVWFSLLCDAMASIGSAGSNESLLPLQTRVGALALDVGRELSDKAVGIVGFAARDIVGQIRTALTILRDPEVSMALGGGSAAQMISRHAPRVLGRNVDIARHASRAAAGVEIIRWIADGASDVYAASRVLGRPHPIVSAAQQWRAVTGDSP